jgi:hypothetical protein
VTETQVARRRLRAQLLAGPLAGSVLEAVERVVGVQAQSWPAARLAVRARTRGLTAADVDRALASGELARTWLMRGTLHLVAAADVAWLTALFGPLNHAASRRRRSELGLTDDLTEAAVGASAAVLRGAGPIARAQFVERLAERGVRIDPAGQAPAHLVACLAAAGVLLRGPDLAGGRPSVILAADVLDAWPQRSFDGDAALAELARRYLAGYGPAEAEDLAAWSGLPVGRARRAFELLADPSTGELLAGPWAGSGGSGGSGSSVAGARLLGAFDTVLLGHRDRGFVVAGEHAKRINAGGGMVAPTLLVGGRVAGVWARAGRRLTLSPFDDALGASARAALEADAADVGRFLGERLVVTWAAS